jgi:hypothetical protein
MVSECVDMSSSTKMLHLGDVDDEREDDSLSEDIIVDTRMTLVRWEETK